MKRILRAAKQLDKLRRDSARAENELAHAMELEGSAQYVASWLGVSRSLISDIRNNRRRISDRLLYKLINMEGK